MVPRRRPAFGIAIPASLVSDVPHLREKTARIGLIGRAAAIFRVEEILVYEDRPGGEADLIEAVLTYMETPQYLRKRLIRLRPELRYVGILPPLRTPHHPLRARSAELEDGELREGVVVRELAGGYLVDVGVERPLLAPGLRARPGKRLTFRVRRKERDRLFLEPVEREEVPYYWGYRVRKLRGGLKRFLERARHDYDLLIGTSKHGEPVHAIARELAASLRASERALLLFGSPSEGLYEMAAREGLELENACDFVVNALLWQGVATIRTEEAIFICLALMDLLVELRGRGEHYGRWHGHASSGLRPQGLHHAHHHDGQEAEEHAQPH